MSIKSLEFEPYVNAAAVAALLNIAPRQVLALTRTGRLPGHPIDPDRLRKDWRYKISEIETAMQSDMRKPASSADETRYNRAGNPASRKAS